MPSNGAVRCQDIDLTGLLCKCVDRVTYYMQEWSACKAMVHYSCKGGAVVTKL